ncbi:MAG: tyrosine-protein phosphatase [Chloroflexota bacterium]
MQEIFSDRVLVLEGSSNIRDIGGYRTRDGKVTRWKTILRSASMDKLPPESQQRLAEHGVKYIVDLRDLWETEKSPNVFAGSTLIIYHHSPVIGVDSVNKAIQETKTLVEFYTLVLEQCGPQIRAVLEVIAEQLPNGCVLFHCWAGKDRTGIVAALLLALAGVAPETIAEDYGLSYALLSSQIETWRADVLQSGRNLEQFEEEVSSRPETMLATLDYLESQLGGVESYLRSIGVSEATMEILRTHMVEDAE